MLEHAPKFGDAVGQCKFVIARKLSHAGVTAARQAESVEPARRGRRSTRAQRLRATRTRATRSGAAVVVLDLFNRSSKAPPNRR